MDRKQDASILNPAFESLGLIFRDSESHQCTSNPAHRASHASSSKSCHDRAGGYERSQAGNRQCADTKQPSQRSAQNHSCSGPRRGSFGRLGSLLVGKIS